jgi:hypothetical protein
MASIAVWLTLLERRRQIRKDDEQSRPNLVVSEAEGWDLGPLTVELSNLGQHPVHVRFVHLFDYSSDGPKPHSRGESVLIPPSSSVRFEVVKNFFDRQRGEVQMFFQAGATGLMYHRVAVPFDRVVTDRRPDGMTASHHVFLIWRQEQSINVGTQKDVNDGKFYLRPVFHPVSQKPL